MKYPEDKKEYVRRLFPLVEQIKDSSLKDKVIETWLRLWDESKWERIESVPFMAEMELSKCSLVQHINFVTEGAQDIGHLVHDKFQLPVDFDVLLAGALLHDASKLVEFEPKGDGAQKTDFRNKITHGAYGAHIALNVGLPMDVVHLIITHTPRTTLMPCLLEGVILSYVDYLAFDTIRFGSGDKLYLEAHKKPR